MARPQIELYRKDAVFVSREAQDQAFQAIKIALVIPEVMVYPLNEGGTFLLDVDASGRGIGAVLSQIQAGRERVFSYGSRSLNKAERNYCITEQELLAVVFFVQYYRQYLLGRRFSVRSDHQALVWLFSMKEPISKIARWIEILAPFDFCIEYRPGSKQSHCDALSRCESPRDCSCHEVDTSEPLRCGPCKKCQRKAELMLANWPRSPTENTDSTDPNTVEVDPAGAATEGKDQSIPADRIARAVTRAKPWLEVYSHSQMAALQQDDPSIGPVKAAYAESPRPSKDELLIYSHEARHYWSLWDQLRIQEGVFYVQSPANPSSPRLLVPKSLRADIIKQMHDNVAAGHQEVKRTKSHIGRNFY